MKHIHIYWHIAQLNHWREVMDAQLIRLIQSGLYDASETINAVILGGEDCALPSKINTIRIPRLDIYEFPILMLSWVHATKGMNGNALYFHTKGVSREKNTNLENWRQLMELDKFCYDHPDTDWFRNIFYYSPFWRILYIWSNQL